MYSYQRWSLACLPPPPPPLVPPLPPQPIAPVATNRSSRASIDIQRRRRNGMPKSSNAASAAPPLPSFHKCWSVGRAIAVVEAAVVFTLSVDVPPPPAARVTLAGFIVQVGSLCAPEGELVSVQVRFIVPE